MNAVEKVSWIEFIVSLGTIFVVIALYPWLGDGATGAFGFLGLLAVGAWFYRKRGNHVVVDERDRDIAQQATWKGVMFTWMAVLLTLIGLIYWSSSFNNNVVPTRLIIWLLWTQLAVCYAIKGFLGIRAYRRQGDAA